MTSEEIQIAKMPSTEGGGYLWTREVAYQLAVANEREEANNEARDISKRALGKKTFQIHQVLDRADVPTVQGKNIRGEDIPLTLVERVKWLVEAFLQVTDRVQRLEIENTTLVIDAEARRHEHV